MGDTRNPSFFLVGCSRSGTTLLQRMLDAHGMLTVIPETRWFARWHEKRYGLTDDDIVMPELIERLVRKHRLFRNFDTGITTDELMGLVGMRYPDFVSYVFDRYGQARARPIVGNKTPGYVRRIRMLHGLWPQARFVHIIRDGRDVYLSAINWRKATKLARRFSTWTEDPVTTAALWWEWDVRLGREAGAEVPYHEVRYEELVEDPSSTCAELCTFLGVPFDESMLRHHENGRDERAAAKHPNLPKPITRGLRDWRTEMSAEETARFEGVAGRLLDELGYERTTSTGQTEHAARLRARFEGRPLPEAW